MVISETWSLYRDENDITDISPVELVSRIAPILQEAIKSETPTNAHIE